MNNNNISNVSANPTTSSGSSGLDNNMQRSAASARAAGTWSSGVSSRAVTQIIRNPYTLSGGTLANFQVSAGGILTVNGGLALTGAVNSGAWMYVYGGTVSNVNVGPGGWAYYRSTVSGGTINGGYGNIGSGAVVTDLTIRNVTSGNVVVQDGGIAKHTRVQSGATLAVLEGAATDTVIESGGAQLVLGYYPVTVSGVIISSGGQQLISGGQASGVTVSVSGVTILSGGQSLVSGGSVWHADVNGGTMTVTDGGAFYTTLQNGGTQIVRGDPSTTWVQNTDVSSGSTQVVSGGSVSTTSVFNGGTQVVHGGSNVATYVYSGGSLLMDGGYMDTAVISDGGYASITGGSTFQMTVFSGGTLDASVPLANSWIMSGGTLVLQNGVDTTDLTVVPGAVIDFNVLRGRGYDNFVQGDKLYIVRDDGTIALSIDLKGTSFDGDKFAGSYDSDGSYIVTICFLAGTMIMMMDGTEKAIETIVPGDRVRTRDGAETVKWIGHEDFSVGKSAYPDMSGYPVRILKDAFDRNVPNKDLLVTAEHCFYFDGKFIPARMLVNGRSVFYDRSIETYTYFHLETENHAVIYANAAKTETYLDTGNRMFLSEQSGEKGPSKNWITDAAAPLDTSRLFAEMVHAALNQRAEDLSLPSKENVAIYNENPCFNLITDTGEIVTPTRRENNQYVFTLAAGTKSIEMLSKTQRPCDSIGPYVDDRRLLGILIGKIQLWHSCGCISIRSHLEQEVLNGWAVKDHSDYRWTTGLAMLKLPVPDNVMGKKIILSVEVVSVAKYQVGDSQPGIYAIA